MFGSAVSVVCIRRVLIAGLAGVAAMALAVSVAEARPKPDFTVTKVKARSIRSGPLHLIQSRGRDGFILEVTVKNVGDKAAAGAGQAVFRADGLLQPDRVRFEVPRLRPDRKIEFEVDVLTDDLSGINAYRTKVGASTRKDTNNGNDYKRGPSFAVIPETWKGTTNAIYSDGLTTQSLVASPTFTLDEQKSEAEKKFVYVGGGSLSATITGDEDPDCTYSGSGDVAIDPTRAVLLLEANLGKYRATGTVQNATYTASASCFGGGSAPFQQEPGIWLVTPDVQRDTFDEVLTGTQTSSFGESWSWTLNAE